MMIATLLIIRDLEIIKCFLKRKGSGYAKLYYIADKINKLELQS